MNMLRIAVVAGLCLLSVPGILSAAQKETHVRVGIYRNPPKIALSDAGKPQGIFVDLIEAIAAKEHWTLEYVPGTWAEGLDRVATGEIDLMPDVAFTSERGELYAFHREPVLSDWFQIYARRGGGIRSLLDLDGKRVAVLDHSLQQESLAKLAGGLGLKTTLVPQPDFDAAFAAVARGKADAVVANRFSGVAWAKDSRIEDTAIIFNPTRVFFAAPRTGHLDMLAAIDRHLNSMKADPTSAYYQSLRRWTSEEVGFRLPAWLQGAGIAAGALLLFVLLWNRVLKRQVALRIRELAAQNEENLRMYKRARESEERFRSFVENANDIVYALNPEGVFTYVSPNWPEILGHAVRDVVGKSFEDFIHPDDRPLCRAALERARNGEKLGGIEYRIRHQDGTWRWHMSNGSFIRDLGNHAPAFLGIARDLTERKRTEERLRLHAQLLDSVRESVVASDMDGRVTYWSRGAEQMYGYSAAEVLGKPYRDFAGAIEPPDEEAFRRQIAAAGSWQGEHVQKNRAGKTFWTSTVISLVADENGKPAGYVGIDRDITERKQAESAQRESQARFAALFDANPAGLMLVDRKTRAIAQVNPAAVGLIGLPAEAIVGRVCHGFMCPAEAGRCPVCDLGHTLDRSERTLIRADGRLMPILKTVVPIVLDGRDYLLEMFIDLSERKKAQEERERLQAQLFQAQKMESVGRLAGGVAHDFNNMLGAILGSAELMLQDSAPAQPHHEDLLDIRKTVERATELVRQLMAFARRQPVQPRPVDLNAAVAETLRMLRRLIGTNVALEWEPSPDAGRVQIDPVQIDQILVNLCVNARDAISGSGTIAIATGHARFEASDGDPSSGRLPGDYALLAVRDTGAGMDAATLGQVFEPFFTTKEPGQGTGMGLATVYGIVKQNRGFIDVRSEPGRGSLFRIYLPRLAAPA